MRRLIVGGAVLALAATWAAPAVAAEPLQVTVPFEFSFEDSELSAECGFTVLVSGEGETVATLYERTTGAARELDLTDTRFTFEAPSTGGAYDFLSHQSDIFDYPEGVFVGAPATVTSEGTFYHDAGVSAAAGRNTWESTIYAIPDDGIPRVSIGDDNLVTSVGRFPDDFDVADLCAALA
jgi:hypothetical protein